MLRILRNCLRNRGKRGRSKWESWHELAVKSCISFEPRRFQNPRRRRTSQSPSRSVRGGRQWRPIAYISPVSRCSRLLITQEFRPRTRVINGSGPSPRYRGTKLRANLPQPYINPDFLTLLSQRSPSSSSFPPPSPSSCCIPPVIQYNEPGGMHHPVSIIRSPACNQIILKSALHSRGIVMLSLSLFVKENKSALWFRECWDVHRITGLSFFFHRGLKTRWDFWNIYLNVCKKKD